MNITSTTPSTLFFTRFYSTLSGFHLTCLHICNDLQIRFYFSVYWYDAFSISNRCCDFTTCHIKDKTYFNIRTIYFLHNLCACEQIFSYMAVVIECEYHDTEFYLNFSFRKVFSCSFFHFAFLLVPYVLKNHIYKGNWFLQRMLLQMLALRM